MHRAEGIGHHHFGHLVRRRFDGRLVLRAGDPGIHDHSIDLGIEALEGFGLGYVHSLDPHFVERVKLVAGGAFGRDDVPAAALEFLGEAEADAARCADDEDCLAHFDYPFAG